jgi:hypothetical protein
VIFRVAFSVNFGYVWVLRVCGLMGFSMVFGWFPGVWPGFRSFLASFGVVDRVYQGFWLVSWCLTGFSIIFGQFRGG